MLNLANEPARPITKAQQTHSKRQKLTQRMKGDISPSVRKDVNARTIFAPVGCCERCKKNRHGFMRLELAHIDARGRIEHKTTEFDLLRLCGPDTDSRTCHYWSNSPEGKAWMRKMQERMMQGELRH